MAYTTRSSCHGVVEQGLEVCLELLQGAEHPTVC